MNWVNIRLPNVWNFCASPQIKQTNCLLIACWLLITLWSREYEQSFGFYDTVSSVLLALYTPPRKSFQVLGFVSTYITPFQYSNKEGTVNLKRNSIVKSWGSEVSPSTLFGSQSKWPKDNQFLLMHSRHTRTGCQKFFLSWNCISS